MDYVGQLVQRAKYKGLLFKERVRFLPTVNDNTGEIVMERMKQMFYRRFPNSNVLFSYRIAPLSTKMGEGKTETPASEHNG